MSINSHKQTATRVPVEHFFPLCFGYWVHIRIWISKAKFKSKITVTLPRQLSTLFEKVFWGWNVSFRHSTYWCLHQSVCVLPHFNTLKACHVTYLREKIRSIFISSIFCRNPMLAKLQDAPNAIPTLRLCANMSKRCMELTFMPPKDIKETKMNPNHLNSIHLSRPRIRSNHHQELGE